MGFLTQKGGSACQRPATTRLACSDLVSLLYHAANARRIPMMRFASSLVREGLVRLAGGRDDEVCVLREMPPVNDPHERKD